MHIVLTDILTCPRCGPEYGLILLAERMQERRVLEGALGCANCREKYAVRGGHVLFAGSPSPNGSGGTSSAGSAASAGSTAEVAPAAVPDAGGGGPAIRLAALLGVTHGPGFVLVAGPARAHAAELAGLIEDIEIVSAGPSVTSDAAAAGVNQLVLAETAAHLPLATGKVPAVALTGAAADRLLEEGVRVLSAVGRIVLDPAPARAAERLSALKLRVLAHEGTTLVAARY